jgi:hypothetical protein
MNILYVAPATYLALKNDLLFRNYYMNQLKVVKDNNVPPGYCYLLSFDGSVPAAIRSIPVDNFTFKG